MKVALYARTATEDDLALQRQISQLRKWVESERHQIAETYQETMASGVDDERPEFKRMMTSALSEHRPFDAIVVCSISRFSREPYRFEYWKRKLDRANVPILSITETSLGGETESARKVIELMGELVSKENSKQVRRSMCDNARAGYFNGSRPPFGYTVVETEVKCRGGHRRKLTLNLDEVGTVRTIFDLALNGHNGQKLSLKAIANLLNLRGLLRRGELWRAQGVLSILHSTAYAGTYYFNRRDRKIGALRPESEWVATPVPPLVSPEEVDEAVKMFKRREKLQHG